MQADAQSGKRVRNTQCRTGVVWLVQKERGLKTLEPSMLRNLLQRIKIKTLFGPGWISHNDRWSAEQETLINHRFLYVQTR